MATEAQGIFPGSFIVETALREGIRDVLANPWLLDYLFASLADDDLTKAVYGQKLIDTMKRWITRTEIPVFFNTRLDGARLPAITVNLVETRESENTDGDINTETTEPVTEPWPALTDPFTPVSWNSTTGELVLPDAVTEQTYVFAGMNVQDRSGTLHPILEVKDDDSGRLVAVLKPDQVLDLNGAVLKSKSPPMLLHLESAVFTESYLIGCHVSGEAWQLTALHGLCSFVLLRYRRSLLESRGFMVSAISSTDFSKNQAFDPEQAWSRYISLTGKCRSVWPAERLETIQGVDAAIRVTGAQQLPPELDPESSLWIGDEDILTFRKKR